MPLEIMDAPAPKLATRTPRLTDEMRDLLVGQSFIADRKTVEAFISHCRHRGKTAVRKTRADGKVQVWRVA